MERLSHTHPDDTSELLSAYSDNAVDVLERRRTEEYLQQCAACVQELRELRMMKELLRELPYVQPPRSFTIDPATAPRPRWLLFPTLRLASLVATMLFVVVLGVDGFNAGMNSEAGSPTAAQYSPQMQSRSRGTAGGGDTGAFADPQAAASTGAVPEAMQMASAAASVAEPAIAAAQASPAAAAAAGGVGPSDVAPVPESVAAAPPPAPQPTTLVTGDTAAGNVEASPASETAGDASAQEGAAGGANDATTGGGVAGGANDTAAQSGAAGTVEETSLEAYPPAVPETVTLPSDVTTTADDGGASSFDTLRIIELVLGVVAVAFGIGAFVAWRRGL